MSDNMEALHKRMKLEGFLGAWIEDKVAYKLNSSTTFNSFDGADLKWSENMPDVGDSPMLVVDRDGNEYAIEIQVYLEPTA